MLSLANLLTLIRFLVIEGVWRRSLRQRDKEGLKEETVVEPPEWTDIIRLEAYS